VEHWHRVRRLCVGIKSSETSRPGAAKKRTYSGFYGRSGASQGWHFLTGGENAIKQLAEELGSITPMIRFPSSTHIPVASSA